MKPTLKPQRQEWDALWATKCQLESASASAAAGPRTSCLLLNLTGRLNHPFFLVKNIEPCSRLAQARFSLVCAAFFVLPVVFALHQWIWKQWSSRGYCEAGKLDPASRWQWPSWERVLWCILMGFQRGRARLALHILFFISCSCRSSEKLFFFLPKTARLVEILDISDLFTEHCFAFSSKTWWNSWLLFCLGPSCWNNINMIFVSSGRTEDQ